MSACKVFNGQIEVNKKADAGIAGAK